MTYIGVASVISYERYICGSKVVHSLISRYWEKCINAGGFTKQKCTPMCLLVGECFVLFSNFRRYAVEVLVSFNK